MNTAAAQCSQCPIDVADIYIVRRRDGSFLCTILECTGCGHLSFA